MQRRNKEIDRGLKEIRYTVQIDIASLEAEVESMEEQLESAIKAGSVSSAEYYQKWIDNIQSKGEAIELAKQWLHDKGIF